jgi:hypothetical protein
MGLFTTSQFHFIFPIVEMCQEIDSHSNQMREDGDLYELVVNLLDLNGRIIFRTFECAVQFFLAACGSERSCCWMSEMVAVNSACSIFVFSVSLFSLDC